MKYKNIDLELPPLGKLITGLNEEQKVFSIGFFYELDGKRDYKNIFDIDTSGWFHTSISIDKWKVLPIFKSVEEMPIPIGKAVIVQYRDEESDDIKFSFYVAVEDHRNNYYHKQKIIGWIEKKDLIK